MKKAYTVVGGWGTPHLDVGCTYESRRDAEVACDDRRGDNSVVEVVCHVEDFTSVHGAMFMVRTDGNHEMSFVVDEHDSDEDWHVDHPRNARLHTRLVADEETGMNWEAEREMARDVDENEGLYDALVDDA